MRRTALLFALLPLVVSSVPAPVFAQAAPVPTEERLRLLFSQLRVTDEVQIVTPLFFVERARFESIDAGVVNVSQGGTPVPLELVDIRAVSLRSNHQWQGAIWGFAAGVLVGSITGMMVGSFGCVTAEGCNDTEREGAIRWGSVLGVSGAAAGFMIGRHSIYWRPVFP